MKVWGGLVIVVFGIVATITAILFQFLVPKIVNSKLKDNLVIKNDNKSTRYQQWKSPTTVPVHIRFYVFDILNPENVRKGKPPKLQERGPYVYKEFLDKLDIQFNSSKPTVTYNQKQSFTYEKDLSCADCNPYNDTITTINAPYMIMAGVAESYGGFAKLVISEMLIAESEELLMTKTVHELVWGYDDNLFKLFVKLRTKWGLTFIPKIDPFMNYQPNNTLNGMMTINTGACDISKVGVLESWKGQSSLNIWKSKYSNMFNGSDGTQFSPGVKQDQTLYFFSPNLCRSVYLKYDSSKEIKGINVLRFTTPHELFENSTENPDNAAFCQEECYPTGILAGAKDCKPSKPDSPIVISTPHFLYGGQFIRDKVEGLHPDPEKHGLFLSIEPMTGIPLQALIRLQLNLHIREVSGISGTQGVQEAYVPIVYFSNEATVDDATANTMRNEMFKPLEACFYAKICLFSLGGLLIIIGSVLVGMNILKARKLERKHQDLSEKTHLINA